MLKLILSYPPLLSSTRRRGGRLFSSLFLSFLFSGLAFAAASSYWPFVLVQNIQCSPGRACINLDGVWKFATDPNEVGQTEKWYLPDKPLPPMPRPGYAPNADGNIIVPGSWDAQGYGTETDKLRHNFVGKVWYKKQITIPGHWKGKQIFLCISGVHRYAKMWLNEHYLGEHIGYMSTFEFNVTRYVAPSEIATITIQVDSKQRWEIDTLTGAADIIDYVYVDWGGIWGHVSLEARSDVYLQDLFVQPKISPPGCLVTATLKGNWQAADSVRLDICNCDGELVAQRLQPLRQTLVRGTLEIETIISEPKLWSTDTPYLYTARLYLLDNQAIIDSVQARFGLREIEIRGRHFYLNGKNLFLRGYGDDHIYPEKMAMPTDKDLHLRRLKMIKAYGFNHVRHHSTVMPPEYYDACDEIGILVTAEFPIAYHSFYNRAKGPALELYKREWAAVIKRHRNHPCIFDWCMGNELWDGVPLAKDFQKIAHSLDPTRPFVDSDGLSTAKGWTENRRDRDTLDFFFYMFHVSDTPLDRPDKFMFQDSVKPVISHETGNYLTFPRLDQIENFRHNFKPFWLTPVREKLKKMNLLNEAELWAENSEHLYLISHKINIEALRKNPLISGYHWWLFQDYWTTSNGLVDTYFRPKSIQPDQVRCFNNDVVLLEDNLKTTYRSGANINTKLLISNFSPADIANAILSWRIKLAGRIIDRQNRTNINISQGSLIEAAHVTKILPTVDTPTKIVIEAELATAFYRYHNNWSTWLYPAKITPPKINVPLFVDAELLDLFALYHPKSIPRNRPLKTSAVYVANSPDVDLLDAAERGACVILLDASLIFPTAPNRFKTAWWYGSPKDNNVGTVVYDNPITREMAPENFCDTSWYKLLEGAKGYILDGLTFKPEVLIRGIEVLHLSRNKALLMQARYGKGCLIISGLNHKKAKGSPEGDWLLARLIKHAGALPKPEAQIPSCFLKERILPLPSKL